MEAQGGKQRQGQCPRKKDGAILLSWWNIKRETGWWQMSWDDCVEYQRSCRDVASDLTGTVIIVTSHRQTWRKETNCCFQKVWSLCGQKLWWERKTTTTLYPGRQRKRESQTESSTSVKRWTDGVCICRMVRLWKWGCTISQDVTGEVCVKSHGVQHYCENSSINEYGCKWQQVAGSKHPVYQLY